MTAVTQESEGDGHARFTYRLRVSSGARTALEAEWSRCRWLWNGCCARSKKAHRDGEKCGPARLDKMLTQARTAMVWLREGSSVPQQQLIRDFAKARAKALKDIKARLPMRQRAGMPRYKKKHQDAPSLELHPARLPPQKRSSAPGRGHRGDGGVVAGPAQASVQRPRVPRQHRSVVRVLCRPGRDRGPAGDRRGDRYRLGCQGDRDHHQRRARPSPPPAREERRPAPRPLPADDVPPSSPKGKAASKGYRTAQAQAAKLHKKVARQRQDTARKWAKKIVRDHDALPVEDFRPKFLAKSTMARKAADAAIAATKAALVEMARKHGRTPAGDRRRDLPAGRVKCRER